MHSMGLVEFYATRADTPPQPRPTIIRPEEFEAPVELPPALGARKNAPSSGAAKAKPAFGFVALTDDEKAKAKPKAAAPQPNPAKPGMEVIHVGAGDTDQTVQSGILDAKTVVDVARLFQFSDAAAASAVTPIAAQPPKQDEWGLTYTQQLILLAGTAPALLDASKSLLHGSYICRTLSDYREMIQSEAEMESGQPSLLSRAIAVFS